jgi:hypothetical protein
MKRKHLILVKIDVPLDDLCKEGSIWKNNAHRINKHEELGTAVQCLAENIWLIERDKGFPFLSDLWMWKGQASHVPYNISCRFFVEECDGD